MKFILTILFAFSGFFAKADQQFDVVVYNATPAGITAAVAAAREGKSVIIVEPLGLVGGIMAGGLGMSDSNQTARETLGGLFEEFHLRVEQEYAKQNVKLNYRVSEKLNSNRWTYEPHVAEKVFLDMLREAGVKVVLNQTLKAVKKDGTKLIAIKTFSGETYVGKIFIDASYEGDLLAMAGVSYRLGRESKDEFNESLAGARFRKKPVAINPYDKNGKLLPLINGTIVPEQGAGDHRIMAYSFRLCLTKDSANRVPFKKPVGYDPKQFELFRQFYKLNPDFKIPFDRYQLPNNKLDGNNSINGQLSLGLIGESTPYPEANRKQRAKIWKMHRDYTEGLLYFLCTDPAVPQQVRTEMNQLGYAKDEFVAYGNFPPVLYVREGRRMVGEYFMTENDIMTDTLKADVIAVSSFPIDSHDCQRIATADGGFINEGTVGPLRTKTRAIGYPYQVPFRAIVPKKTECSNLIVPVSISASHIAFCSIRVEPTWMVLGQSAGIAAAVAIEQHKNVQDLDAVELQQRLMAKGQILKMPTVRVLQ